MVDIIIGGESGKLHAVYHKSATPARRWRWSCLVIRVRNIT